MWILTIMINLLILIAIGTLSTGNRIQGKLKILIQIDEIYSSYVSYILIKVTTIFYFNVDIRESFAGFLAPFVKSSDYSPYSLFFAYYKYEQGVNVSCSAEFYQKACNNQEQTLAFVFYLTISCRTIK